MNWADALEARETLCTGQAEDLKYDDGECRVWLSRCGLEDGEPFARTVSVEILDDEEGRWETVGYFNGDEEDPAPDHEMGEAFRRSTLPDRTRNGPPPAVKRPNAPG
jgi:hypothetical protein